MSVSLKAELLAFRSGNGEFDSNAPTMSRCHALLATVKSPAERTTLLQFASLLSCRSNAVMIDIATVTHQDRGFGFSNWGS